MFPQLFMLQRTGEAEMITTHYIAALGIYRALYIPNWIYRSVTASVFPLLTGLISGTDNLRPPSILYTSVYDIRLHTDWLRAEPDTGPSNRWTLLPLLPG